MVSFAEHVHFLDLKKLVVNRLVSLCVNHSTLGAKKTQAMNFHSGSEYHTNSLTRMSEFVKRYKNPSQTIATQLNTQLQKIMENNRKVIESLLQVVMLYGKQGLAF